VKSENKGSLLRILLASESVSEISGIKNEQHIGKIFMKLLEIDEDFYDLKDWNKTVNSFTGLNESFDAAGDARHRLMSFLIKERWHLIEIKNFIR